MPMIFSDGDHGDHLYPFRHAFGARVNRPRLSYLASCRHLGRLGENGEPLPIPNRMPRYDGAEPWGVNFFREQVQQRDFSNLTLPRTYFGRSELKGVRFRNTDLSQSNLCWNDFIDVDFSKATLEACDLRCSLFERVKFIGANLRTADLRRSSFKACLFVGANVQGAILARAQSARIALSKEQRISVDWRDDEGPEPDGG
jgi:BTB/POZ domain-containing protein KCTD9